MGADAVHEEEISIMENSAASRMCFGLEVAIKPYYGYGNSDKNKPLFPKGLLIV